MAVVGGIAVPHPPIILPEVGRGEEWKIEATIRAYREAARTIADMRPDTIIITSPHTVLYAEYFHVSPGKSAKGNLEQFRVRGVSVETKYDEAFAKELEKLAHEDPPPAGTDGERDPSLDHGTLIPLRFLQEAGLSGIPVVRVGLSGLDAEKHYQLGQLIAQTAEQMGRKTVIAASGDLSHKLKEDGPYGYAPQGPQFDKKATEALREADFMELLELAPDLCEEAAECGLRSFLILAGALDGKAVAPRLLSYEGPFGVGYGVATFHVTGNDPTREFGRRYHDKKRKRAAEQKAREDVYVRLARASLEHYVNTGTVLHRPEGLPDEMLDERAGVFVSLKKRGKLRGCIGTIAAGRECIADEIINNAVSAGTEDPRFAPVSRIELEELTYSVDVLGKAQPVESAEEFDTKRFGVIVTSVGRRGLLLPDLEGIDTPQQQIEIALQKAGIGRGEPYSIKKFEVIRHK